MRKRMHKPAKVCHSWGLCCPPHSVCYGTDRRMDAFVVGYAEQIEVPAAARDLQAKDLQALDDSTRIRCGACRVRRLWGAAIAGISRNSRMPQASVRQGRALRA